MSAAGVKRLPSVWSSLVQDYDAWHVEYVGQTPLSLMDDGGDLDQDKDDPDLSPEDEEDMTEEVVASTSVVAEFEDLSDGT